jgi:TPR repeat protein
MKKSNQRTLGQLSIELILANTECLFNTADLDNKFKDSLNNMAAALYIIACNHGDAVLLSRKGRIYLSELSQHLSVDAEKYINEIYSSRAIKVLQKGLKASLAEQNRVAKTSVELLKSDLVTQEIAEAFVGVLVAVLRWENNEYNPILRMKKMAEDGDVQSQRALGQCYGLGRYVEKDFDKNIYWTTKAAEQGCADAQWTLGSYYKNGNSVEKDYKKAFYWFTKAAELGNVRGQCCLADCYMYEYGTELNYKNAFYWYNKAATQEHSFSQLMLGYCYADGLGVTEDVEQAMYWFTKVANLGNNEAQGRLGVCFYEGEGVIQNYEKAVYWFKKAAEMYNAEARYYLGQAYYNGEGVTQDCEKAFYWLKKAAAQGHEKAIDMVEGFIGNT